MKIKLTDFQAALITGAGIALMIYIALADFKVIIRL